MNPDLLELAQSRRRAIRAVNERRMDLRKRVDKEPHLQLAVDLDQELALLLESQAQRLEEEARKR